MNATLYARLMEHFAQACDLPAVGQREYVERLAVTDDELARSLGELLAFDRQEEPAFAASGLVPRAGAALGMLPAPPSQRVEPPFTVVGSRYHLEQFVGAGGMGAVFRAHDTKTGDAVAVKLLLPHRLGDEGEILRFRREFRAIARLQHPHIVRGLAEGEHDGWRYIVTEYVPGGHLGTLTGAPVERILTVLLPLVHALDYLHCQRMVHRDLKPANVLLTASDPPRPKLADFGIVREGGGARRLTSLGAVQGTLDFVAPEQLAGEPTEPRTDLYALGCMLHVLCAGRPPFDGEPLERMLARLSQPPPSLHDRGADVPPPLDALAQSLMAREPRDRPRGALEVAHALGEIIEALRGTTSTRDRLAVPPALPGPYHARAFLYPAPFAGRDRLRKDLRAEIERLRAAPAPRGWLALVGPPGQGKSALLASIVEPDSTLSIRMGPDDGALDPWLSLSSRLGAKPVAGQPGGWRTSSFDAETTRRHLAEFLAVTLDTAAKRTHSPVCCVVVDDAQWLQPPALEVLRSLSLRLNAHPAPRAALITAARPEARELLAAHGACVVEVPPLDHPAVSDVAATMLGIATPHLPAGLSGRLLRQTAGNPLLVRLCLEAMVTQGEVVRIRGGWRLDDAPAAAPPADFAAAVTSQVNHMSADTRRFLAHVSVLGVELDPADLGLDIDDALEPTEEALRFGILVSAERPGCYRFVHESLPAVLYAELPAADRAALHDRAGASIQQARPHDVVAIAHHVGRGTQGDVAIPALLAAGEHAASSDPDTAERFFARAIEWAERGEGQPERLAQARQGRLDALLAAGRPMAALKEADALLPLSSDPAAKARAYRAQGRALLLLDEPEAALNATARALEVLGAPPPRSRWGAMVGGAWRATAAAVTRWGLQWGPRMRPTPRNRERLLAHRELAMLSRWVDFERGFYHIASQLHLAERIGTVEQRADAYAMYGFGLSLLALPRPAARYSVRAEQLAEAAGDVGSLAWLHLLRAGAEVYARADWAASLAHFDEAVARATSANDRFLVALAVGARGWMRLLGGMWEEATEDLDRAMELSEALGTRWLYTDAALARGIISMAQGDWGEATATAEEVLDSRTAAAMPALRGLAHELRGAVDFVSGKFAAALERMEHAQSVYDTGQLHRGWGLMIDVEIAEAAVWKFDQEAQTNERALVRMLQRSSRRANRHLRRIPYLRGYSDAIAATAAARSARNDRARALYAEAHRKRPAGGTYMDAWMDVRSAIEAHRAGESRAATLRALDGVAHQFEAQRLFGMLAWLDTVRGIYSL